MLRDDFAEIFDYVTAKSSTYSLNTNGTLITPEIAQLLRRKGSKMVAVYGATAEVYDRVTRNSGGFEALLSGLHHLREAGAGFTVQLIPMRDNWEQWDEMVAFAKSWSRHWRVGAPWLFACACGDATRNAEIARQRLDPADVVELDRPDMRDVSDVSGAMAAGPDGVAAEGGLGRGGLGGVAARESAHPQPGAPGDDRLYAACIAVRRDLHVDPYGGMTFCDFVKDPALRYDLRAGTAVAKARGAEARGIAPGAVQAAWEEFIPSLADAVHGGAEYLEGCAACELRADCRWCDVYGYLEHGRHGASVEHLCAVAREARAFRDEWARAHRRFYEIAGITVQVESDLRFADGTLDPKFESFRRDGPGSDTVVIRHHFGLPYEVSHGDHSGVERGEAVGRARDGTSGGPRQEAPARDWDGAPGGDWRELYRKAPWAIYRVGRSWVYEGIAPDPDDPALHRVAVFNADHTRGELYDPEHAAQWWRDGGLGSLTMFPSDQIWLAQLLADRDACYLHSGAIVVHPPKGGPEKTEGTGLLFVGHSDAGKSTTMTLVKDALGARAEILCDDRNIVRRWPDADEAAAGRGDGVERHGFWVHGTWSHGDVPDVSAASAPLRAILFLEQSARNELVPLTDRKAVWQRLLATLIRPLVTAEWMHKSIGVLESLVDEVPCYAMRFDRSGAIVPELEKLAR